MQNIYDAQNLKFIKNQEIVSMSEEVCFRLMRHNLQQFPPFILFIRNGLILSPGQNGDDEVILCQLCVEK